MTVPVITCGDCITALYNTQASQVALYVSIWNDSGQPLEIEQAVLVANLQFYTPQYRLVGDGVKAIVPQQGQFLIGNANQWGQLMCLAGGNSVDRSTAFAAMNALLRADALTFAYRTEDARLNQLNSRRLNERFRLLQHLRGLSSDASVLAKSMSDIYQSIEDGRARADAAAAYFATRIVDATDSSGKSVWSDVYQKVTKE